MQNKIVTVFGGSGFLGRYVVKELARGPYLIRVVSRNPEEAIDAKVSGIVGQVTLQRGNLRNQQSVEAAVKDSWAVINLTGILFESGKQSFPAIHAQGAERLAKAAKAAGVERFVHVSALGVDKSSRSSYARSKLNGERAVLSAMPGAVVLRPSVIFGSEDNFFNQFARLARLLPFLPLIGGGRTRFQPVYVMDVAKAIVAALDEPSAFGKTYEIAGPATYTFRELMEFMLQYIDYKPKLVSVPFGLAKVMGGVLELLPHPMLTRDQVTLLQYDNVLSSKARTLKDLGVDPTPMEAVVPGYLGAYRKSEYIKLNEARSN